MAGADPAYTKALANAAHPNQSMFGVTPSATVTDKPAKLARKRRAWREEYRQRHRFNDVGGEIFQTLMLMLIFGPIAFVVLIIIWNIVT